MLFLLTKISFWMLLIELKKGGAKKEGHKSIKKKLLLLISVSHQYQKYLIENSRYSGRNKWKRGLAPNVDQFDSCGLKVGSM
jgi:hypothetical protein